MLLQESFVRPLIFAMVGSIFEIAVQPSDPLFSVGVSLVILVFYYYVYYRIWNDYDNEKKKFILGDHYIFFFNRNLYSLRKNIFSRNHSLYFWCDVNIFIYEKGTSPYIKIRRN